MAACLFCLLLHCGKLLQGCWTSCSRVQMLWTRSSRNRKQSRMQLQLVCMREQQHGMVGFVLATQYVFAASVVEKRPQWGLLTTPTQGLCSVYAVFLNVS